MIALVAWALLLSTASAAGAGELEEAHRLVSNGDCEGALLRIEALLAGHPDPSQAADAELLRGFCWRVRGDEDAYLESLRRIPDKYPGTEGSARALVSLGLHYARNEERDEARRCFERALTEVDPNSKWAQVARSELEHLDWYLFSPLYDRLMNRIDRWVLAPFFPDSLSWVRTALDLALTRLVVKLVALAFCLAPLWISQRSVPPRPRESMLRGPWSAGLLTGVLVALWSLDAAREVVWAALSYKGDVTFFEWESAVALLPSLIAVAFILYRESPRRLFAPPHGGIVRSLGCVAVALLSFFVLSSGLRVLWVRLHGAAGRPLPIVPEGLWWPDVALLAALGHYLIVAVAEEAVYRGVLQETFRHYLPSWTAVLSVSLLFGVIHVRPLVATLPLVAFGAVAGVLVLRFRSLLPVVILHWAVNFLGHLLRVSQ